MFRLAKLSLANRALIALMTVFASVFGVITMSSLKQELIPSIEFPQITVLTSMPGASPEVVDKQVSSPLETALKGVEGLESTSSTSRNGVSQISMVFTYGSNLDRARNQIDRAISNAKRSLPDDVQPQAIAGSISDFPIVFLAVSSDKPLSELNADLARLTVPRLQKLDGVRGAEVTGGATQHIKILPRPEAMAASGASIQSISEALRTTGRSFRPAPSKSRARRCRCRSAARSIRSTPSRPSPWAAPETPRPSAAWRTSASPRTPAPRSPGPTARKPWPCPSPRSPRVTPWASPTR